MTKCKICGDPIKRCPRRETNNWCHTWHHEHAPKPKNNILHIIIIITILLFSYSVFNTSNNNNIQQNIQKYQQSNNETNLKTESEYYDCPSDPSSGSLSPEAYRKMGKIPPQCKKENSQPIPTYTPKTISTLTQSSQNTDSEYNPISETIKNSYKNITESLTNSFTDLAQTLNKISIDTKIKNPEIDEKWVLNFLTIVNNERVKKGLPSMKLSNQLNNIASIRFKKMMENPFISHYGADAYNVGEVVFYPDGFTEQNYVDDIQKNAYLHWDLLMYPVFTQYGFHIEEGPTLAVYEPCSVTEIPGPNIDEKEFFRKQGCSTKVSNSVWLVIDMT